MTRRAAHEISPIELEIIHNALTAAAAEMDVTVWRTSRSTIVRELLDYSTAIFDRDGWNVAQAARIPSHLNSMSYFLTEILARHIPADQWQPDDIVISNDPYCGGQHLPDIVAFKAVFHEGRRIGFVGTLCHHLDVGGSSPGSYGSSATEIFQEGLRIPPVEAVRGGQADRADPRHSSCRTCASRNCCGAICSRRSPRCNIGAASIERLARKLGEARFERALKQLLDASEAGMRAVISRIPDGTYEFEDKHRRRRHHRPADPHPCQGDRGRRRNDGRSVGVQPAVAGAEQRHACLDLLRRVLRADGDQPMCRSPPMPAAIAPSKSSRRRDSCVNAAYRRRRWCIASPSRIGWQPCCSARCTRRCRIACRPPTTPCPMS